MRARDRSNEVEWLEAGRGSPVDVAANLAEIWRINARLGGLRALTLHLYPRLARQSGPLTVLDLGAGGADVAAAIDRWARGRGWPVRVVALDRAGRVLRVARARLGGASEVRLVQADVARLPLPAGSVDWIISTLMLHHFPPTALVELLGAAMRCARCGLVMSDLVRGRAPLFAFQCLQPLLARNVLTRHDGALSIRRAYTPVELRAAAVRAGLPRAAVHAHFPWRMTLVAEH